MGVYLWNSFYFGLFLYIVQLLTSIFLFKLIRKNNSLAVEFKQTSLITSFTDSVKQNTFVLLEICGFTIVFGTIKALICRYFALKGIFSAVFTSLLEISEGVFVCSRIQNTAMSLFFTGFAVGFGGICMCFQTFSACKSNISRIRFVFLKLLQGLLCGVLCYIYSLFFDLEKNNTLSTSLSGEIGYFSVFVNTFMWALALIFIKNFLKSKIFER